MLLSASSTGFEMQKGGACGQGQGTDSSSDARAVMRHRWITDEDADLGEERASNDTDQLKPDSIRMQEWLEECRPFLTQLMDPSTDLTSQ
jgi:hypothetical protein